MEVFTLSALIIPAFIAGMLTFLAPCTLPLLPAFLAFISGSSAEELKDPDKAKKVRLKMFLNGLMYVLGFSLVFMLMGSLFGLGGQALFEYRIWLTRIGGVLVIFFGLYMTGVLKLKFLNFLNYEKKIHVSSKLKPGEPTSALLLGGAFAFGWTPCVGPILGSILTLAAASATVSQGIILLAIFSAGLAVPFLLVALFSGYALARIKKFQSHLNKISIVGGVLLIFFGILLLTNQFAEWTQFIFRLFDFLNYQGIQNRL